MEYHETYVMIYHLVDDTSNEPECHFDTEHEAWEEMEHIRRMKCRGTARLERRTTVVLGTYARV